MKKIRDTPEHARRSRWTVSAILAILTAIVGLSALGGASYAAAASSPNGSSATPRSASVSSESTRVKGSDGVVMGLRLSTLGCLETLDASADQRNGPYEGSNVAGSITLKSPPKGLLSLVVYEPNHGILVAYAAPEVARVRWLGADGKRVVDTLAPWRRWVAELGPEAGVPGGPTASTLPFKAGTLVAFNRAGKKVASVRVTVTNDTERATAPISHC
jgi:hypothetical protein